MEWKAAKLIVSREPSIAKDHQNSKETLGEVMSNVVELSNLEKEIIDNAIKVTKEIKKDE